MIHIWTYLIQFAKIDDTLNPSKITGVSEQTSLHLPPTTFVGSSVTENPRRASVHFIDTPLLLEEASGGTVTPPPKGSEDLSASFDSGSTSLDDSLYTVYNTPRNYESLYSFKSANKGSKTATLNLEDHNHSLHSLNYTSSSLFNGPSTSRHVESFLELPQTIAMTPTYHIREAPQSVKITNYFAPLGKNNRGKKR